MRKIKQKLFMLVYEIDVDKGGLTRVMLNRSSLLSDEYDTSLVTLDFNIRYEDIIKELVSMGRLSSKVELLNPYEYYRNLYSRSSITALQKKEHREKSQLIQRGYEIQDDEIKEKKYARYFKDGVYQYYKKWDKLGNLLFIDYFNAQRNRILKEEFLDNGLMYRKTYYDINTNSPRQQIYYTNDGKWYLNNWINPKNGNVQTVFLRDPKSYKVKMFQSNETFHTFWIEELCVNETIKPIMICDGPGSAKKLLDVDSNLIYKLFTIHSNHFDEPYTKGSPPRKDHLTILENIERQDALVVLTNKQKHHIQEQYRVHDNIHVIPHYIEQNLNENNDKDEKKICVISRLHPEKRIDLAIRAFNKVVQEVDDAKLEIHGEGEDRERLEKIISELKLEEKVVLKGYTIDIDSVYAGSLVTLLSSQYEGFSLAILESMASGTPAISFEVLYGPEILIDDGQTGFLVKDGDIDEMANKVVYLLKNPEVAKEMGKSAQNFVLENFQITEHKNLWLNLLGKFK